MTHAVLWLRIPLTLLEEVIQCLLAVSLTMENNGDYDLLLCCI